MTNEQIQRRLQRLDDALAITIKQLREVYPRRLEDQPDSGIGAGVRVVAITTDGGSAGDDSTECSFTYTFEVDGVTYSGVGMTGHGRRNPLGEHTAGTVGAVYLDESDDEQPWKLWFADEQPEMDNCPDDPTPAFGF